MTAMLDPSTAERLAKLCGMFGSSHDNERAIAARKADEFLRERGVTWSELLQPEQTGGFAYQPGRRRRASSSWSSPPMTTRDQIQFALANLDTLSRWERGFVYSVWRKDKLSTRQREVLDQIVTKVRAGGVR